MSMLNFTVGPVTLPDAICQIGGEQVPYFRTPEFSTLMLENERWMTSFSGAPEGSRAVFLTTSGTGGMEAAVINLLTTADKVLVINGGSFGQRFEDLCSLHGLPHEVIRLQTGEALQAHHLAPYAGKGITALLVNVHETSTGVHYDLELLGNFCRREKAFFIVDAISSFLADPFHMEACGADVMITSSQKALACAPGIAILVLAPTALERLAHSTVRCMYLNLNDALRNGERGQTPFTPAVGVLRQIHARLAGVAANGGVAREVERVAALADDFRQKIAHLPLRMVTESPSNAVTALYTREGISAHEVFEYIKDHYHIWICPNGGAWRDTIFRVGHIGHLTPENNTTLVTVFDELLKMGKL